MFISNIDENKPGKYVCNYIVGKYIMKKGIPLLSMHNNKMIFPKTDKLQEVIDKMPLYIKIIEKVGDTNE